MVKVTVTNLMSLPSSVSPYTTERLPPERLKWHFVLAGFTNICQNNLIFSYSQSKITDNQLETFRTIIIIVHNDWPLQLRRSPLCETRAKVEVKAEYLNTKTGAVQTSYTLM